MINEGKLQTGLVEAFRGPLEFSCTQDGGVRSSKRTDILNEDILGFMLEELGPDWIGHTEHKIPCARATEQDPKKKFSIDVVLTNKQTNEKVYILLKSIESSYNKNRANFANCTIGEVERIYGYCEMDEEQREQRQNDVTLFLTLLPVLCPVGDRMETTRAEKPSIRTLRLINPNVHQICAMVDVGRANGKGKQALLDALTGKITNIDEVTNQFREFFNNVKQVL